VVVEAHGHAEVVFAVVDAQIGNFVASLSNGIAEAGQNNHRDPRHPKIPQLSKHIHVSSFSLVKVAVPR
jgi:hypothetical protein